MAFPLIFIGLILVIVGARDKTEEFEKLISSDLLGEGNETPFLAWIIAVLVLAAIGSYKPLRGITDGFLILIGLVIILSNRGFFNEFQRQAFGKSYETQIDEKLNNAIYGDYTSYRKES